MISLETEILFHVHNYSEKQERNRNTENICHKSVIVLTANGSNFFSFIVCMLLLNSTTLYYVIWFKRVLDDRPSTRDRQHPWSELVTQIYMRFLCQAQPMF